MSSLSSSFTLSMIVLLAVVPYFQVMETATQIIEFVTRRMRMSHIYQPLLIRALVRAGGSATLRQLATALMEDESQLLYYEDRIKKMPLLILRKHRIVTSDRNVVSLNAGKLSYEERAAIELACMQKLAEFLKRRGLATWDYRLIDTDPVRADVRYQVLAAPGQMRTVRRPSSERRIEVDHIVPRSRGGANDVSNLRRCAMSAIAASPTPTRPTSGCPQLMTNPDQLAGVAVPAVFDRWSGWLQMRGAGHDRQIPALPGLYRIRRIAGEPGLTTSARPAGACAGGSASWMVCTVPDALPGPAQRTGKREAPRGKEWSGGNRSPGDRPGTVSVGDHRADVTRLGEPPRTLAAWVSVPGPCPPRWSNRPGYRFSEHLDPR